MAFVSRSVALILVAWVLSTSSLLAATANAIASAVIVSPAQSLVDANTQLLVSSTAGMLTLSIPSGSDGSAPSIVTLTASGGASGSASVFAASASAGLAAVLSQIATSGGTLSTSGTLSGTGVQIVVLQAPSGGGGGAAVTAIVTYN